MLATAVRSLLREPVAALFLVAALLAPGALGAEEPLTDEDIVQRFVEGATADELIELIRTSEVDFDLAPEMLAELELAGLPEAVLRAMTERQAEQDGAEAEAAAPGPEPAAPSGTATVRLSVRLRPGSSDRLLSVDDALPPELVRELGLGPEESRFTDAAVVLLCRTADHVPDHWRSQTPLGRDFVFTPRHRLLAFLSGATAAEAGKLLGSLQTLGGGPEARGAGRLELALPEAVEVQLTPGVAHDLTLGIALQTGDRYFLLARDDLDGLVPDGDVELDADLKGPGKLGLGSLAVAFRR